MRLEEMQRLNYFLIFLYYIQNAWGSRQKSFFLVAKGFFFVKNKLQKKFFFFSVARPLRTFKYRIMQFLRIDKKSNF